MIIALTSNLGCGKDYIIDNVITPILLELNLNRYLKMAFADQIKINVMTKNNIKYSDVYITKTAETRILLQTEGELLRKSNKNIWTEYLDNWIKVYKDRNIDIFLISDLRYKNEYDYIKKNNGIVIKIIAKQRNYQKLLQESKGDTNIIRKIKSHQSECDLDDLTNDMYDLIVYNDFLDDLELIKENLKKLLIEKSC
jgi:hypothetical protein